MTAPGRSATVVSESELLNHRQSQFDAEQPFDRVESKVIGGVRRRDGSIASCVFYFESRELSRLAKGGLTAPLGPAAPAYPLGANS